MRDAKEPRREGPITPVLEARECLDDTQKHLRDHVFGILPPVDTPGDVALNAREVVAVQDPEGFRVALRFLDQSFFHTGSLWLCVTTL